MKKALSVILTAAMILSLSACTHNELPECEPGNRSDAMLHYMSSIMKGTDGYYYKNKVLFYHDNQTGNDAILCSKPQCLHDGDEFCIATSGNEPFTWNVGEAYSMYNNYIYKLYTWLRVDNEDRTIKSQEIRLRKYDLQGNECSELGVIAEMMIDEKEITAQVTNHIYHKGKLFCAISGFDDGELFEVNLENGNKKQIVIPENEEGGIKETPSGLVADGDYLYYAVRYKKYRKNSLMTENDVIYDKTILRRYNIMTGETEDISALPDIYSSFTVNDGNIYYTTVDRVNNAFCFYSYDIAEDKTVAIAEYIQQNFLDKKHLNGSVKVTTDRKYLYISTGSQSSYDKESSEFEHDFYIYSFDGEQLLHGLDSLPADIPKWSYQYKVLDGEFYMEFRDSSKSNNDKNDKISGVYMIKTEDLINGCTDWTKLYKEN